MTTFINLHILQPFSYANPNRDDTGAPKNAIYGGVLRGRISSQSWKRAIRVATETALNVKTYRASPSSLAPKIAEIILEANEDFSEEQAWAAAWIAAASFSNGKVDNKAAYEAYDAAHPTDVTATSSTDDDENSGSALSWFTATELELIGAALVAEPDVLGKVTRSKKSGGRAAINKALKPIRDSGFGPTEITVAAFGRMYADAQGAKVDASVQVAHAITTSEMSHQIDYFTAVDDIKTTQGAGHLGLGQFTGGIYYRYISINVDELAANCGGLNADALQTLVEQTIVALPSGKQNSTANHEAPLVVLAEVRDRSLSYASAFETPVPADAGANASVSALLKFAEQVKAMELTPASAAWAASSIEDGTGDQAAVSLNELIAGVVTEVS